MSLYCTLADARSEVKSTATTDDATLYRRIRDVSRRLDNKLFQRRDFFVPVNETRQLLIAPDRVNTWDNTLFLDAPLLSLSSVVLNGQTLVVGTDVEAYPTLNPPYYRLRLIDWSRGWYPSRWPTSDTSPPMATVGGLWGFHRDYANAWLAVDTLNGAILAGATSLTVNDVDGADGYGYSPRISAGNLLRIDSEYFDAISTNTATNAVGVRPTVNGSTSAGHSSGATVYVFLVDDTVRRAVYRQTAFLYARKGAYESAQVSDAGTIHFPSDVLAELQSSLDGFSAL